MKKLLIALALCFGLSLPADATILYSGGEQPDFICTGACNTGGTFRATWARTAVTVASSSSDPPSVMIGTGNFTAAASDIWLHFQGMANNVGNVANNVWIRFLDSAGNAAVVVRGSGTSGSVKISSRTSGGAYTDLITCTGTAASLSVLTQYDIHLNFASSGAITWYENGAQTCTYSGNMLNGDGSTTIQQVQFNGLASAAPTYSYSEVIVADEDTRTMGRWTMNTSTSGATTAWTNSAGTTPCSTTILAQIAQNDANYVSTGSNTQIELCVPNKTLPGGSWAVKTMGFAVRGMRGVSGPQNLHFMVREGSTNYTLGSPLPLPAAMNKLSNALYPNDPATSLPWTSTTITDPNFQLGFQSEP